MKNKILQELEDYFKNTPRDKVLSDWNEAKSQAPKNSITVTDFLKLNRNE